MPKSQKRDSSYYEERLKKEFPAIYTGLQAGKHRTVTDAAIAAGLKKPRTRLHELTNAWNKASHSEQADFLNFLRASGVISSPAAPIVAGSTIAVHGILTPAAVSRIQHIMTVRRLRMGMVMAELGSSRLDASVGMAMKRGTRVRADVVSALEDWLDKNSHI